MKSRFLHMGLLVGVVVLLAAVSGSMAASIPGTIVAAKVTTGNDANTFAIGDTEEMAGTPKQVANTTAMMAITPERRKIGMSCYVIDEETEYRLVGGIQNSNWVLLQSYINYTNYITATPYTNYVIAGYWTNDVIVQQYFETNINNYAYESNFFYTNYNFYTYPTNLYWSNILDGDTTISNFWATNWTVFPTYVSNYFQTNIIPAITNAIYIWWQTHQTFTNITITGLDTDSLVKTDDAKQLASVPNGTGLLANNGSGVFNWTNTPFINQITINQSINVQSNVVVNGNTIVSNLYVTNGIFQLINTWPGPTNGMDCGVGYQEYTAWTPCAVTVFSNGVAGFAASAVLSITNASDSNITLYVTAELARSGDYVTSYTITNNDVLDLSVQRINNSWTKYLSRSFP